MFLPLEFDLRLPRLGVTMCSIFVCSFPVLQGSCLFFVSFCPFTTGLLGSIDFSIDRPLLPPLPPPPPFFAMSAISYCTLSSGKVLVRCIVWTKRRGNTSAVDQAERAGYPRVDLIVARNVRVNPMEVMLHLDSRQHYTLRHCVRPVRPSIL